MHYLNLPWRNRENGICKKLDLPLYALSKNVYFRY